MSGIHSKTDVRWGRGTRDGQRGVAVAELAVLTPVLFLLILGAFELARGVWTKHTLSHLARETARYAAVRSQTSDDPATEAKIIERAESQAIGIDPDLLTVETTWTPGNVVGGTVQIQVAYEFEPVTPLLPFSSIALTSNSRRVIAY